MVTALGGFAAAFDLPHKPCGLVGSSVGARCEFSVPPDVAAVAVGALFSYERNGCARIDVHRHNKTDLARASSPVAERAGPPVVSLTIDTRDTGGERVSVFSERRLQVPQHLPSARFALLAVSIVECTPPRRDSNKVKLVSIDVI